MEATRRSQRTSKRPFTYWDEFVATDKWYVKELVADVPPDELQAALVDEDFEEDFLSEEGEGPDEQDADADYNEESGEESDEGEEDLQWTSEGERSGEEDDGGGEGGSVG